MLVVEPEADPVGQLLPLGLVLEHALPRAGIELGDAERLDVLLAVDAELLLDLDLHRQAVRVPARDAGDLAPLHRVEPADKVLDGAREDVMDAGPPVGGRRTLVEHERRPVRRRLERAAEEILRLPQLELPALELVGGHIGPCGKARHLELLHHARRPAGSAAARRGARLR